MVIKVKLNFKIQFLYLFGISLIKLDEYIHIYMIISRIPATKVDHFPPHFPVKIGFFYIYFYFFGGGSPKFVFDWNPPIFVN